MKHSLKKMICAALCAAMILPLAACKPEDTINPGAEHTLKVSVYAAGYGTGWIEEACRIYSEDHPDVAFKIEANNRMFDTIKTRLETDTCDSDIVLIANANYVPLVALNKLEDLTDLYDMVIPDTEDTTLKDVIPEIQYNYRLRNGKIYGVPWQDATASGFIYNKKMFAETAGRSPPRWMNFSRSATKSRRRASRPSYSAAGRRADTPSIRSTSGLWNITVTTISPIPL